MLNQFFALHHPNKINISVNEERKLWFKQFIKSFAVVFFVYFGMYLVRNNIKAAHHCSLKMVRSRQLKWG